MKKLLFLFLAAFPLFASTATVSVVGVTPQQFVLDIQASDASTCQVQVYEDAARTKLVHATDNSLFGSVGTCGYNPGLVNGNHYVYVVGSRTGALGSDGMVYSFSLQTDTTYYWTVSLAGTVVASGTTTTRNKEAGDLAPDQWQYLAGAWGGWPWPTPNWADLTTKYIDPRTGFALQYLTAPNYQIYNDASTPQALIQGAPAPAWTSVGNIGTYSDGAYASVTASGPSNMLYLSRNNGWPGFNVTPGFSSIGIPDDYQITLYGWGDPVDVCQTFDGQNCHGKTIKLAFRGTTNATSGSVSSPYGTGFSTWGPPPSADMMIDADFGSTGGNGTVSISGTTLTLSGGRLPDDLKPGMIIQTFQNGANYQNWTIAKVNSTQQLTLTTSGTLSGSSWQLINSGYLVWRDPAGTVGSSNIDAASYYLKSGYSLHPGAEGSSFAPGCQVQVSVGYAADGTQTGAFAGGKTHTGWICQLELTTVLSIPDTGESRLLFSSGTNDYFNNYLMTSSGFIQHCYYNATDTADQKVPPGHWAAIPAGQTAYHNPSAACVNSNYPTANPAANETQTVAAIIQKDHPEIDQGWWGGPQWDPTRSVRDESGGASTDGETDFRVMFNLWSNDTYWVCDVNLGTSDITKQGAQCWNSWANFPIRWTISHSVPAMFVGGDNVFYGTSNVPQNHNDGDASGYAAEYDIDVNTVYNNTGVGTSLTGTFVDPQTCEALGVSTTWSQAGTGNPDPATGNRCIRVNVASEPVDFSPSGRKQGFNGKTVLDPLGVEPDGVTPYPVGSREGPYQHNTTACNGDNTGVKIKGTVTSVCWGYLQPVLEGDLIADQSQPTFPPAGTQHENMRVVKKTTLADGTIDLVLQRNYQYWPDNPNHAYAVAGGALNGDTFSDGWQATMASSEMVTDGGTYYVYPGLGRAPTFSDFNVRDPFAGGGSGCGTNHGSAGSDAFGNSYQISANCFNNYKSYGVKYNSSTFNLSVLENYNFQGAMSGVAGWVQTHAGPVPHSATKNDSVWAVDGRPYGEPRGGQPDVWSRSVSLVSGYQNVYDVGFAGGATLDIKHLTFSATVGRYLMQNISSPTAQLSDTNIGQACYAYQNGQCVTGGVAGHAYISQAPLDMDSICDTMPDFGSQSYIYTEIMSPCVVFNSPEEATIHQFQINQNDALGSGFRDLGAGFDGPYRTNNFYNAHTQPDGTAVESAVTNASGGWSEEFKYNLSPWPAADSINRTMFQQIPITLGPGPAGTVRVRFGYAEYGRDSNNQPLFCSGNYHDDCSTATTTPGDFNFATSDTQTWATCTNGCTIKVPAISGRILFYVVDRNNGGTVTSSPLQTMAVQ